MTTAAWLPGVSAEDLVAVVRVHLDRVHDAVRRLGCDEAAALEVVETSAMDLVEAVADTPEAVPDPIGWWFARARLLGKRVGSDGGELPLGSGLLSVDEDQVVLAEALEQLPERDRAALLLRDSYDLPAASVGAALGTDAAGAMELVGRARLAFLPYADDEPAPPVPPHQGDLGALARVAEGGRLAPADATPRRHAMSCGQCRSVIDAQQRAHLLLAGLAVVAIPEADRAAVLGRVDQHAAALLPTSASLRAVVEDEDWEDEEDSRLFSPLLAFVGLVLATALGIALGVALTGTGDGALDPREAAANVLPPVTPAPALSPAPLAAPPPTTAPRPRTTVFVIPDPTTPAPTTAAPAPPAVEAEVAVAPSSGPDGARLTVTGTGWEPGGEITLDYLDAAGRPTGSRASTTADGEGRFSATLTARDPGRTPGRHAVRASDGTSTASAPYDVTG